MLSDSFQTWINHHALLFCILVIAAVLLLLLLSVLIYKIILASSFRRRFGSSPSVSFIAWHRVPRQVFLRCINILSDCQIFPDQNNQSQPPASIHLADIVQHQYQQAQKKQLFQKAFSGDTGCKLLVVLSLRPMLHNPEMTEQIASVLHRLIQSVPNTQPPWSISFVNKMNNEIQDARRKLH